MDKYANYIDVLQERGQYRTLKSKDLSAASKEYKINLSSNDYLGLSHDLRMQTDFFSKLNPESFHMSAVSSRLLTGNHSAYEALEQDLCAFMNKDAALVFSSGYHVNMAVLSALPDKGDLILADKLVHASLIDGMKLSQAECIRFRHLDYQHAERILKAKRNQYQRVFLLTESVFSMDGDSADAQELKRLKEEYELMLIVDEAHSFGVMGKDGKGWCDEHGIAEDADIICATFGKACASYGAFLVCSNLLREVLVNRARSLIFTTALPPVQLEWTRYILSQLPSFNDQRLKLTEMGNKLRKAIADAGFETLGDSHIVPLICGSNEKALHYAKCFQDYAYYVLPIRPPSVPEGRSRLRFSLHPAVEPRVFDDFLKVISSLN